MAAKDALMGRFLSNTDKFSDKQLAETLHLLVDRAVKRGASDIHIEPHERLVLVRYRIDGTLRSMHKLPRGSLDAMMVELKKQARLDTHETHTPQEGEYQAEAGDAEVTVRVTTMPVYGGEKAVLHISFPTGKPSELAALGFWGEGLATLQRVMASPHGLVVVAAPRHGGLSSTLYSLLDQLNSPMVSMATIESRPKHRLHGVSHTYIAKSGLSVLESLRAALRQDPNIIMVADVPDGATAELAVHTATTGHLVLLGLRAENSVAAALRLRVAGVEPFLLVSAWQAGIGQRLVRRLCAECRERYALDGEEQQAVEKTFGITAAARKRVHDLERSAEAAGIGEGQELNSTPGRITHLWRAHAGGCQVCDYTGYHGRTAILEVLARTPGLEKGLMDRDTFSVTALQAAAVKDGFVPMALDGLIKALRGQTTASEVLHAVSAPGLPGD